MTEFFYRRVGQTLADIGAQGLTKPERIITSPQSEEISIQQGDKTKRVLNFCANNYLGLADHPEIISAAKSAMDQYGFGTASVRFICGTFELHKELEARLADFFGYDDSITFAACFDANAAVFEPLLGPNDAIVSDSLNHASIIDGVRLCKAKRYRYANNDVIDLEKKLTQAKQDGAETILVVTDGVFSMDGVIANLAGVCQTAKRFDALVMIDDCHASGFLGDNGQGTAEYCNVIGQIDILTGTLGKALGGGMGGFICASQQVIDLLRQRARPYLFSNALSPALIGGALKALDLVEAGDQRRANLRRNAALFRAGLSDAGFTLAGDNHPIIPVMLGEATLAQKMATDLLNEGIYVIGFSFPVVPKGAARIRTQMSAAHTLEQIEQGINAFIRIGRKYSVVA